MECMASATCCRCKKCFEVGADDLEFYQKISPTFMETRFSIPPPSLCPDCRLQRRFAFRNERHLYKRRSCLSGTEVVTIFAPESPYQVCTYDEWWSDAWDPLNFGRAYDPNRPFTDQLLELSREIPHCPLYIGNAQNSDYTNYCLNMKDCYLMFGATDCDHCLYGKSVSHSRDVLDALSVKKSELCYEGIASEGCYQCSFFMHCVSCTECLMVEACESCNHCALCYGLYRKEYCILNEYVGKERYEHFIASLKPLTGAKLAELRHQLDELVAPLPHRAAYIIQSEDCSGDNIAQSRRCSWCFDITGCEDCKYLFWTPKGLNSYDCCYNAPDGVELCYEVCSTLGSRCLGTFMAWNNDSAYYSLEAHYNRDIFGCVGVRHKQYCILNREYSKDEYERTVCLIIRQMQARGEWGEYLSENLSLFGYNESIAQEYFPLTAEEATQYGFKWRSEPKSGVGAVPQTAVPESIEETSDSILKATLRCSSTGREYRITPSELAFYRRVGVPVPILCPDERHARRLARRNPLTLWRRTCDLTQKEIMTSYAPQNPLVIYSDEAYREYLYGV